MCVYMYVCVCVCIYIHVVIYHTHDIMQYNTPHLLKPFTALWAKARAQINNFLVAFY